MSAPRTHPLIVGVQVSDEALSFISYMEETDGWKAEELHYFLEKPWKWTDEYDAWLRAGKPDV